MAERERYEELARQLSAVNAVKRDLARVLPADCPPASAAVLTVLDRHGEMRMSRLAELLAIDMSVTSRHVAHGAERGWIDRDPDPGDRRSRILRLTPAGKQRLLELGERYTQALAHCLSGWSDEELGQLNALLAKLHDSFGVCRGSTPRFQDLAAPPPVAEPSRLADPSPLPEPPPLPAQA
ncbi:MarR family winged helix-turn-helix transcriptional regulator [Streptomyces indicus]|uniref:DNA-binding transcriptional regulator, MarR family n=1 Tax=Streptomyces indicus TaxID=417292 RepID=A0A1G9ER46_9ACTN|nr:MarR family winged helix-turn-helix transcriptional regulator [Streptomyces indicus]SDK78677.1 DNA-binding transcriptional regulator, MarR family [Streptomyces indicus]